MENIAQYMFANAYSSVAPAMNLARAVCTSNGQPVDCGPIEGVLAAGFGIFMLVFLALAVLMIVSVWKVYTKAGKPGWASIIPIYNIVVLLEIVQKPIWWVILMFIPFVNIIVGIIMYSALAKSFGKGVGFTIGLILLPFIFYPILAFGKSTYMLNVSGMGMPPMQPVQQPEPTQFASPETPSTPTTPENPQM